MGVMRQFALLVAMAVVIIAVWAAVEPFLLSISVREVAIERLPGSLDGIRLVHISDMHLRRIGRYERRVAAVVLEQSPSILFVTGDIIDDARNAGLIEEYASLIGSDIPSFWVLGNNDERIARAASVVESALADGTDGKATLLSDDRADCRLGGHTIRVVGLKPYLRPEAASDAVDRLLPNGRAEDAELLEDTELLIVLSHSPDLVYSIQGRGVDLMLSGHTHGGQVCLPLIGPLITHSRYGKRFVQGLHRISGMYLNITRGTGTAWLPIRLLCRPEVSVLVLRSK